LYLPSFSKVTGLLFATCRAHTAKMEKVTHPLRFNPSWNPAQGAWQGSADW
jgi:hypothetical protein